MTPDPSRPPPAAVPPSSTDPAPPAVASGDPLERLFRYAARAGRVHPLQHLLQRYRAGERA
jgi:hypothetical protein